MMLLFANNDGLKLTDVDVLSSLKKNIKPSKYFFGSFQSIKNYDVANRTAHSEACSIFSSVSNHTRIEPTVDHSMQLASGL